MLGLNKKHGWIIVGVILMSMLGVASLVYAFSFTPTVKGFDNPDTGGDWNCIGTDIPITHTMPTEKGWNGWDIDEVGLLYFPTTDTLYVGVSMCNGVIAGDVDNDGNPGGRHNCLKKAGGRDYANLGGPAGGEGEAIDFVFDPDNDGTFEYIAGVSRYTSTIGITVAYYGGSSPPPLIPGTGYSDTVGSVTASLTNNPSGTNPDFEFTINNFSSLRPANTPADEMLDFDFVARTGSTIDAGIGEDILEFDWNPTAVTLSSFAAKSSAGSSVSELWLGLVGLTVLAAGSLFWAKLAGRLMGRRRRASPKAHRLS